MSILTQEQKNNIRKNLPLKIFERREDAAKLMSTIEFFRGVLYKLNRIELNSQKSPRMEFSGADYFGEPVSAACNVHPDSFKDFRNDFAQTVKDTLEREKRKLDNIPDAKIIPFDFRKKEVEPDRQPCPNPPPEKEESQTILKGSGEIAKAAGIRYSNVKPFIRRKGLPAFKIPGRKFWFAFPEEIEKWKKEHGGDTNAN